MSLVALNGHPLGNLDVWRADLGMLPVPLYGQTRESAFVLLNGARANILLDLREEVDPAVARSEAWSSNLGYRVTLRGREVRLQRWDRSRDVEVYPADQVLHRFERFHRYLELQAPPAALSVVAHTLTVFRSLRAALGEGFTGEQALNAFLVMLAASVEEAGPRDLDRHRWGLEPQALELADEVQPGEWDALLQALRRGRPVEHVETRMPLVLRHAAGQVFQEAHYAAEFEPYRQMSLGLIAPDPVAVARSTSAIGLHFTPSPLARTLVEEALRSFDGAPLPDALEIFDPACGSGEFLREFLRQLHLRNYDGRVRLIGWDLSPAACAMSRFALAWERMFVRFNVTVEVVCQDALAPGAQWPEGIQVVLMNPPFRSWRDMSTEQQSRVVEILGADSRGPRPDMAMAFLKLSVSTLEPNGTIGTVMPASFLDGTSAAPLREDLGARLQLRLLARLGSQQLFHDAQVDAALIVARLGRTDDAPLAFWSDHRQTSTSAALRALRSARSYGSVTAFPVVKDGYSIYPNPEIGRTGESWAPRPYEEWQLLTRVQGADAVGDVFAVRQGAITGLNKVFILTPDDFAALPPDEQRFFRPAVLNGSFAAGRLIESGYVFYPYGQAAIETEEQLRERVPTYFAGRLNPSREALLKRKRISEHGWWLLSEYRAWQVPVRPKIVTAYFGDVGSFAWDETGEHVVVQGYAWLPNAKAALPRSVWLAYLALLNSPIMSALLAASSNNVGGGQWNLSKRFVSRIPWVHLTNKGVPRSLVTDLAKLGEEIHLGMFPWTDQHSQLELRELAAAAFGDVRL